jgi:hypothetical protein
MLRKDSPIIVVAPLQLWAALHTGQARLNFRANVHQKPRSLQRRVPHLQHDLNFNPELGLHFAQLVDGLI